MKVAKEKHLNFTELIELDNWSTYSLLGKNLIYTKRFAFVRIGQFLIRNKEQVLIQDDILYKRPTIRINGIGISLRDIVKGNNIGTKNQFRIHKGQFLLSKIDARNGAFGVVPKELEDGIITGNFWTFDVDYNLINPHYLTLLTRTKKFQILCQTASVGTTNRNYLQEKLFLNFKIPLPTLNEQNEIVNSYNQKLKGIKEFQERGDKLNEDIEKYLLEELGVEMNINKSGNTRLQLIQYKETNRWDTLFLLGKLPTLKSKYTVTSFSDIIKFFNKDNDFKSIRIDSSKYPNEEYRFIGMEHIEKETGRLLDMQIVKGKEIKSQTIRVPANFIVYGKLRPYLNKYWINKTEFDNIICSSEFFVFDIDDKINKLFFKYVLSSKVIQEQIADKTSGARMPRINEAIFFDLKFPLPPRDIQDKIASKIDLMKNEIESAKVKATNLLTEAEQEFEKAIFNN